MTAAELLELLIEQAPKLRVAGVSKVALEGLSFELLPAEPEVPEQDDNKDDKPPDPFHDPATFGGRVPGNQRRERT